MALPYHLSHGPVRFLLHYVRRNWASHALVLAGILVAVGCATGSQYGVKNLVDVLSEHRPSEFALWSAVAILLALVAGDNLIWRFAGWMASYAFTAVGRDLRLDLFTHLTGHSPRYFMEQYPGALAGRITASATAAWTIENSLAWNTIPPAVAVVSAIAMLGSVNWRMTVLLAAVVVALGAVIGRIAARNQPLHGRFAHRAAAVSGELTDVVSNISLVRSFGSARREQKRLARSLGDELTAQRDSLHALEGLRLFHAVSVFVVTGGVLGWAVMLWRAGSISTGDVVLTTTLGFTMLHASRDFAMAAVELVQHFAKLGEALEVLGQPHELKDAPGAKALVNLGGTVSFSGVCFSYPGGERVLQDFHLHVPAGQKLGLVGRSGAGKSTILALLQRFYDPERGYVMFDEQPIATVAQESLRQQIAVVQQDVALLHRSILENLRYGRPDASDHEVIEAAELAHCMDFIGRQPQGFHTIIGDRGLRLSGGERQRLAIARAFLRNAPIILLDEATSSLDTESEQLIQRALARLFKGRTVIAIAHRLSTLASFDRILVLERGRIVEDGGFDELRRQNGAYSRMYRRQFSAQG
jgi:ATP-binding cassette subfamily B protein